MCAVVGAYNFYTDSETAELLTVPAPVLENMEFIQWSDDSVSTAEISIPINSYADAHYRPIIQHLDVTFSKELLTGEAMPALEELDVTISNQYRIDSNVALEWICPGAIAESNTAYTSCIRLDTSGFMATNLSAQGSESDLFAGSFTMSVL